MASIDLSGDALIQYAEFAPIIKPGQLYLVKCKFMLSGTGFVIDSTRGMTGYDQYHHGIVMMPVEPGRSIGEILVMEFAPVEGFKGREIGAREGIVQVLKFSKICQERKIQSVTQIPGLTINVTPYDVSTGLQVFLSRFNLQRYIQGDASSPRFQYNVTGQMAILQSNCRNCQDFCNDLVDSIRRLWQQIENM